MGFNQRILTLVLLLAQFASVGECWASATRTVPADQLQSADTTKTYLLPAQAGSSKIMVSAGFVSETPSGSVNGSNTAFTLANTPFASTTVVFYIDGVIQVQGTDYTISGATITMTTAPSTGQSVYAVYSKY